MNGGLVVICWRLRLLTAYSWVPGGQVTHEKKPGPSIDQSPWPRGQQAPDFGKFSATQRVPPQVGSIRVTVRFITCATCTPSPAYSGKACTGGPRRNVHLKPLPLSNRGQRIALPGGRHLR